jgi:quaternary ammonium compound-resistance protein SugE
MAGLAYALRTLPAGTAYAVRVGIGASLTVAYGMWTGDEPISIGKGLLLCALIATIIGLKLAR